MRMYLRIIVIYYTYKQDFYLCDICGRLTGYSAVEGIFGKEKMKMNIAEYCFFVSYFN